MRPLFSERRAMERMGPVRRVIHRMVRRVYWSLPVLDKSGEWYPWGPRLARVWGWYRGTWPK